MRLQALRVLHKAVFLLVTSSNKASQRERNQRTNAQRLNHLN
jgi:hypothetical protein